MGPRRGGRLRPGRVYLLAAGKGERAGGPKAWLESGGKPLLERQLDFLLARFEARALAVSVQEAWLDRCRALHPLVQWVAVDPGRPALASLAALCRAMPLSEWTFLYHVDMPVWEAGLWDLLGARAGADGADAVVPTRAGRGGHPVLLGPGLADGLSALDPARDRLDRWLRTRRAERVEVPYACAVENWNEGPRG